MSDQQTQLRDIARQLLTEQLVQVVIGYAQKSPNTEAYPVFITKPEDVDALVWNDQCMANLTAYLTRKEIKALGKPAIVVKGCDERALVVLEVESQISREDIVTIGMACEGVGNPRAAKCSVCDVHMPRFANHTIGEVPNPPITQEQRYEALDQLLAMNAEQRMAFWKEQFSRCIKCYACRQVCPLCYCNRCIVEKNRPTVLDTSATLKGNYAWHITRAFHLAGRCIGCDECTRACPAGIDLRLLNLVVAKAAEEAFDYRAGMDPKAEPAIGSYSLQDKEEFIR